MALSIALFLATFLSVGLCNAWVGQTTPSQRTSVALFGSKAATTWAKKQEWLAKRGFDIDGVPKLAMTEIVGSGRIGSLLAEAGECIVVGREDSISADGEGPILVATRNDALDGIIDGCPENRRKDLVFMQNGYLDKLLESKGLQENTQVLLYLSVTAKGAAPIDGVTAVNPEGLTTATGLHAENFAKRLEKLDLKCRVVEAEEYRPAMFEKLM